MPGAAACRSRPTFSPRSTTERSARATLDVFETEPLPATSPLWAIPKVTITPHNSAISDEDAVGRFVLRQIERHERGPALRDAGRTSPALLSRWPMPRAIALTGGDAHGHTK